MELFMAGLMHDQINACGGNFNMFHEFKQLSSNGASLGINHCIFIINIYNMEYFIMLTVCNVPADV